MLVVVFPMVSDDLCSSLEDVAAMCCLEGNPLGFCYMWLLGEGGGRFWVKSVSVLGADT